VAKTRKTEKAVEIHEFYVIRTKSGSLPPLCTECATGDAIMLPAEQAAIVANVPVRMIYRWVETATIHYREAPNGSLTVCLKSLPSTGNQVTLRHLTGANTSDDGD
jgi:hypothetical protein